MYNFVVSIKPRSYNSKDKRKTDAYRERLQIAFAANHPSYAPLTDDLYGLVYHFYRVNMGIDADNISKPVWDCLTGVVYDDDKQVKMRIAGSFNLTNSDLTILDLSGLSGSVINSLTEALENEEHVLYVECGRFTTDLIRLTLEGDAN